MLAAMLRLRIARAGLARTACSATLAFVPFFSAAASGPASSPSTLGIVDSGYAVPIRIENELLYVAGSVNQSTELAFVVDTGATATSLDPQVAQAAKVKAEGASSLLVGRRYFPQQSFQLASTAYIAALSGHATAGVMGQPQFTSYSLAVDFDRRLAALLSPEICPSSAAHLPIFTAGGLPFVEGSIPLGNGQQATGLFLVDTGQPGPGIVLASGFVAAHPELTAGQKLIRPAAANHPQETLIRLKELTLGPLTLHAPIAVVSESAQSAGNPRLAGVLGLEALSRFNFVLNRRYATLYLEPNKRVEEPFEADMSGLTLRASEENKLVVSSVIPGSAAAASHLQAGDVLLRMEDKPVAAANLGSVSDALRSLPGAAVHLEVARNGKMERVVLHLKRMI